MAEYHGASHDGDCGRRVTDAIDFEWAEVVPRTTVANEPLARIICESS